MVKTRTIVTQTYAGGVYSETKGPSTRLTAKDISELKNETIALLKPQIIKAGFEFVPSLWKWFTWFERRGQSLYVKITWEDVNNDGKVKFTNQVKKSGILNKSLSDSKIIKNYS